MRTFRPFASTAAPKTLQVPGEPGQTVTIRRLGWKALQRAEAAHIDRAIRFIKERGVDALQAEYARYGGEAAVRATVDADPSLKFDAATLIAASVCAWDPPRTEPPADGSELQRWLQREIACFSNPTLASLPVQHS